MKRRIWNQKLYYICSRRAEVKGGCSAKIISAAELKNALLEYIQIQTERAAQYRDKQICFEKSFAFRIRENYIDNRLRLLKSELKELESAKSGFQREMDFNYTYTMAECIII